jgi:electron transfer flavoprotein alpha subunit
MNAVLIVAEHDGRRLSPSTARTVTCARQLPDVVVTVAVLAAEPAAVAEQAAALQGVDRVITLANPANAHALAAVLAPQVVALAQDYSHVSRDRRRSARTCSPGSRRCSTVRR